MYCNVVYMCVSTIQEKLVKEEKATALNKVKLQNQWRSIMRKCKPNTGVLDKRYLCASQPRLRSLRKTLKC